MRKPVSTIIKARTGAHTIGSLIVSASLAAKTEADDLGEGQVLFFSRDGRVFLWVSPCRIECEKQNRDRHDCQVDNEYFGNGDRYGA